MNVQPDRRWEAFAAREPYFAVFTDPKFLSANRTANNEREFFDSGELLADAIFYTIKRRMAFDYAPQSILEFGCGPGRLAIPFARRAVSITAVDRSPAMLEAAKREAARQSITNIHFTTAADFDPAQRKFDLVNAYLLFQRLPPTHGLALFRQLLGCIGSGGFDAGCGRDLGGKRHIRANQDLCGGRLPRRSLWEGQSDGVGPGQSSNVQPARPRNHPGRIPGQRDRTRQA